MMFLRAKNGRILNSRLLDQKKGGDMKIIMEANKIQNTIKKVNFNQKDVKNFKGEVSSTNRINQSKNLMEEAQGQLKSMNHHIRDNNLIIKLKFKTSSQVFLKVLSRAMTLRLQLCVF